MLTASPHFSAVWKLHESLVLALTIGHKVAESVNFRNDNVCLLKAIHIKLIVISLFVGGHVELSSERIRNIHVRVRSLLLLDIMLRKIIDKLKQVLIDNGGILLVGLKKDVGVKRLIDEHF